MVNFVATLGLAAVVAAADCSSQPRYIYYFDQYHTTVLPNKTMTAGITHVITAFANSSLFTTEPVGTYAPFKNLTDIRPMFDDGVKVCMAIGGWGDTAGFRIGLATEESRALYAKNIATTMDTLGYDCVDIDYEYPGGNGYDYKQVLNSELTADIENFPPFLTAIKAAIGTRELSIAVPAKEGDMIAFTAEKVPLIDAAVDFVNIMTYDIMNRRDTVTKHHTDIVGSLAAIDAYLARGMTAAKMNLGFAMYAKYFQLAENTTCNGLGCPIVLAEDAEGQDTGTSGTSTFENSSYPVIVDKSTITESPDGSCGVGTTFGCTGAATSGACCSQYSFCGDTDGHCGTGCQADFGTCTSTGKTTAQSFADAMANGTIDTVNGGAWFIDTAATPNLFWTFEHPSLITQKFADIVSARKLGGVFAWSLAQDSYDWSHMAALQAGFESWKATATTAARRARRTRKY